MTGVQTCALPISLLSPLSSLLSPRCLGTGAGEQERGTGAGEEERGTGHQVEGVVGARLAAPAPSVLVVGMVVVMMASGADFLVLLLEVVRPPPGPLAHGGLAHGQVTVAMVVDDIV